MDDIHGRRTFLTEFIRRIMAIDLVDPHVDRLIDIAINQVIDRSRYLDMRPGGSIHHPTTPAPRLRLMTSSTAYRHDGGQVATARSDGGHSHHQDSMFLQ